MASLLLGAAVGLTLQCSQMLQVPPDQQLAEHALNPVEAQSNLIKNTEYDNWPYYVCNKYTQQYYNVRLKVLKQSNNTTIEVKTSNKSLGQLEIGEVLAGRAKIQWHANTGTKKYLWWIQIQAQQDVWVFRHNLNIEEKIKKSDIKKSRSDVAKLLGVQTPTKESPAGKITRRTVRKGAIITENLISPPPLIRKNDAINIIASNAKITLSSRGIALNTGWKAGEHIQVKVNGATEAIRATVSGKKTAHVDI
ncbi:MAG: flagella basal body P-ring formation protein FlgA [Alteromonadaceae bacterium]|nr:MAG: flagella basal body P-ring formation protein FlgA [Alteromonadaceae bacterium]